MGRGGVGGRGGLRGGVGDSRRGFGESARGRDFDALARGRDGGMDIDLKKHGGVFGSHATEGSSLRKSDGEYVFVADLPGFETEEIDLSFDGDALVVTAESHLSDETMGDEVSSDGTSTDESMPDRTTTDADEIAVRREFIRSRRVSERVTIPEEIAEDEISATYRNGVSASSASGGSPDLQSGGVLEVYLPLVEREDEDDATKIDIAD